MESPQESVLWSTPIPYINDLNGAATHSKVHHFVDDTHNYVILPILWKM